MGKIKSKLSKKSRSNKPKHRDDADFESAVSKIPRCMTHESSNQPPPPPPPPNLFKKERVVE
jgi:hypothetical protein